MNNDKDCRVGNVFLEIGLLTMTLWTASNEVNLVRELNLRVHFAFGNVVETLCSCNNYQFCGVFDICYSHYIHLLN